MQNSKFDHKNFESVNQALGVKKNACLESNHNFAKLDQTIYAIRYA
jgi:hypothetical protein